MFQMKLYELHPPKGACRPAFRKGRGVGSGNGKTSGRGQKGQLARTSGNVRPGFEGGQMPIYRRLPKRGFKNIFAKSYISLNVERLNKLDDNTEVTAELLKELGIISNVRDGIVILGRGELNKKLIVKAKRFSKSAEEKILNAGGKVEVI